MPKSIEKIADKVAKYDENLADDIRQNLMEKKYGLVFEESRPQFVELNGKPIVIGDKVISDDEDVIWDVVGISEDTVEVSDNGVTKEYTKRELTPIAFHDDTVYTKFIETNSIERNPDNDSFHTVINGENYHALQSLLPEYEGKIDCIYIDPPFNNGAKNWKYNNSFHRRKDKYKHSRWLTFMEDRLNIAKKLLKKDSVIILAIDERELYQLGLLIEQVFTNIREKQMITLVINEKGTCNRSKFSRVEEHLLVLTFGNIRIKPQWDDMLTERQDSIESERTVEWEGLRRRDRLDRRKTAKRPNQFYAIYVNRETGTISHIGNPLKLGIDRNTVVPDDDEAIIWPLDSKGNESIWSLSAETLRRNLEKGYVRVRHWNKETCTGTVQYLMEGAIRDIENGEAIITGYNEDGSVNAVHTTDKRILPKKVWFRKRHNAFIGGTNVIKKLIPLREFHYPKSLYAVEDILRFYISDNPEATVLDFFAGSGTTCHAVMRLNKQDGGHRKCISVTNNDISEEETEILSNRGFRKGDEEWENRGICKYITEPRLIAAVTGKTPEGNPIDAEYEYTDIFPMSEGFKENIKFYDMVYVEPTISTPDNVESVHEIKA